MSPRIKICKETECNDQATTKGYCRFHYLKNWSHSRRKNKAAFQDLNRYVEGVVKKHPEDYITEISKDLNRWQEDDTPQPAQPDQDYSPFGEFDTPENLDDLLDNLKYDDDY